VTESKDMIVDLVYEKTCPNIARARKQLIKAFTESGVPVKWQEWEVSDPAAPAHIHGYGSPTILVNKQDVSGQMQQGDDYCCRVYSHDEAASKGVPAVSDIVDCLKKASPKRTSHQSRRVSRFGLNSSTLPAIGVAFLPKLACPACWTAYAGLLSAFGISFVDYTPYLLPLTSLFLIIALAALAFRAPARRGYQPLALGILASIVLLVGKFQYASDAAMYVGLFLLVSASLWNTWPKAKASNVPCPACVSGN